MPTKTARNPVDGRESTVNADADRPFNPPRGVISTCEIYTLPEFQRRARLGQFAMRQARRRGLRVFKIGRREYVRGDDLLKFFDKQATDEAAHNGLAGREVAGG